MPDMPLLNCYLTPAPNWNSSSSTAFFQLNDQYFYAYLSKHFLFIFRYLPKNHTLIFHQQINFNNFVKKFYTSSLYFSYQLKKLILTNTDLIYCFEILQGSNSPYFEQTGEFVSENVSSTHSGNSSQQHNFARIFEVAGQIYVATHFGSFYKITSFECEITLSKPISPIKNNQILAIDTCDSKNLAAVAYNNETIILLNGKNLDQKVLLIRPETQNCLNQVKNIKFLKNRQILTVNQLGVVAIFQFDSDFKNYSQISSEKISNFSGFSGRYQNRNLGHAEIQTFSVMYESEIDLLLLTGAQGEIFSLDLEVLASSGKIKMKNLVHQQQQTGHHKVIFGLNWLKQEKILVSSGLDKKSIFWEFTYGSLTRLSGLSFTSGQTNSLEIDQWQGQTTTYLGQNDKNLLILSEFDRVFNSSSQPEIKSIYQNIKEKILSLAFNFNKKYLAMTTEFGKVLILDLKFLKVYSCLPFHKSSCYCISWIDNFKFVTTDVKGEVIFHKFDELSLSKDQTGSQKHPGFVVNLEKLELAKYGKVTNFRHVIHDIFVVAYDKGTVILAQLDLKLNLMKEILFNQVVQNKNITNVKDNF